MSLDSRYNRSDAGIMALTHAVLVDIFGLSDDTSQRVIKIIRNQGELQNLKQNLRGLSGMTYRRLNHVIDLVREERHTPEEYIDDIESSEEDGFQSRFVDSVDDVDVVRAESLSFVGYLLNELQYDVDDLRDPEKRQEITRLMRSPDSQAASLAQKAARQQKQEQRQAIQKETDPKRAALQRKKMNLQKQLQQIDQQLASITPE